MKNRSNLATLLAAVFFFSVSFAPVCLAVDKFIVTPKLDGSWKTESNFFRSETGERAVDTYLIQPGVELGYETAKSLVTLDATLNFYDYNDNDDVTASQVPASDNDYTGYTGIFNAVTMPTERLKLGLDDSFTRTRDQAQSDRFSNAVDLDEFFVNRLTLGGFYELNDRFSTGLRYRNQVVDYDKESREDSFIDRGLLDLIYNVSPTTLVDLNYQLWYLEYKGLSSDYTSNQLKMEFRKQFMHVTFEIAAGFHNRDFEAVGLEDITMPIYKLGMGWRNPPEQEETPVSFVSLKWDRNMNDLGYTNGYHKSHLVDFEAGHIFAEKIPVQIKGSFLSADYQQFSGLTPEGTTDLRDDQTLKYVLSAGYIITDWLTLAVEGGREERNSNLQGYDYDNDFVILLFKSSFNFGAK